MHRTCLAPAKKRKIILFSPKVMAPVYANFHGTYSRYGKYKTILENRKFSATKHYFPTLSLLLALYFCDAFFPSVDSWAAWIVVCQTPCYHDLCNVLSTIAKCGHIHCLVSVNVPQKYTYRGIQWSTSDFYAISHQMWCEVLKIFSRKKNETPTH